MAVCYGFAVVQIFGDPQASGAIEGRRDLDIWGLSL